MVVGKQVSLAVRGAEVMADSNSASTGPPGEAVALAKEDPESRSGGSPQQQDDTGNAAPASQFRITSVAQVEGEEAPGDPLETSVNDGLRTSICLSDSTSLNSVETEQTDEPDPLTPTKPPRPPSPVEEGLQCPAPQNHQSLRANGSHLTTQQSLQQGSSRFRKVNKYQRERWQVEDSVETDRAEEGKSASTVLLTQAPVLLAATQSGLLADNSPLASSSSPSLSTASSAERWEGPPAIEPQETANEKAAEPRPQSKLASHEVKVQLSPQMSVESTVEGAQPESLPMHDSVLQSDSSSPSSLGLLEDAGRELGGGDVVEGEESAQCEGALPKSGSSTSGGTRTPVAEMTMLSVMAKHMGEVGDMLTKLQRMYGVINNEHANLAKQLEVAQIELATLKEKHKTLKKENEAVTKDNERLRSKLQKFENESKHNKSTRTAQNDHKEPARDPL